MSIRAKSTRIVYQNRWIRLREDVTVRDDGVEGLYAYIEKEPFAVVLPWDGSAFTLIRQHRYPVGRRFWEFPQGALDGRSGAAPEEIARTELREETGLTAGRLTRLGQFYIAYGMSDQMCTAFLAEDLSAGEAAPEPEEHGLEVKTFPLPEIESMIEEGQIMDSATLAALYLWKRASERTW
ncbi:MAG: NUDIX hydrolase [Fimbriimonadaceae bacterium]